MQLMHVLLSHCTFPWPRCIIKGTLHSSELSNVSSWSETVPAAGQQEHQLHQCVHLQVRLLCLQVRFVAFP